MNPVWTNVPIDECGEPLVNLAEYPFILDPRYFKDGLTTENRMFVRRGAAERLAAIQSSLIGFRFKIWDAYRPLEVQRKLYDTLWWHVHKAEPDWTDAEVEEEVTKYVSKGADPSLIPPHATGGTVDLTLVDTTGKELDMGTHFDHFGIEASPQHFENDESHRVVHENRARLLAAMSGGGFIGHPNEWWHFEYGTQRWALETSQSSASYGLVRTSGSS